MATVIDTLAVDVEDLRFSYPDGRKALRGVNLQVCPGEKLAILGPNGAGKSTFLLHMNGLLHGQGSVRILGREVQENDSKSLQEVRALVGLVFQDPDDQLFSPTVYEDVAFGPIYMGLPKNEVSMRVREALEDVGLEGYADRMPFHLSGGEKKRAAIATVLSMRPEILVLDEPSAGLDPRARRGLIKLLDSLKQTIVITTHDMHMVKEIFPRSVIMDGGVVVADAPTHEILADQELLERHGLELP
jgi:cobalt/nickel transport system ATP-binding protein